MTKDQIRAALEGMPHLRYKELFYEEFKGDIRLTYPKECYILR